MLGLSLHPNPRAGGGQQTSHCTHNILGGETSAPHSLCHHCWPSIAALCKYTLFTGSSCPRGGRAAITATWPTVRFLPCGSERLPGATGVSCGGCGRWGEAPCRRTLLQHRQLPPATEIGRRARVRGFAAPDQVPPLRPLPLLPLCHCPGQSSSRSP